MTKKLKRCPSPLSNMAAKIKKQSFNNGIDFKLIKSWTVGDTFVIQKKDDVTPPVEVVISSIVQEIETDSVFPEQYYVIHGQNDMIVKISNSNTLRPRCEDYEIFKNWRYYFQLKDRIAARKKNEMLELKQYLDTYFAFRTDFEHTNPEKLI